MAARLKWHRKLKMIDSDKLNCGARGNNKNKNAADAQQPPARFARGILVLSFNLCGLLRCGEKSDLIAVTVSSKEMIELFRVMF
jgi:hypothetical protein